MERIISIDGIDYRLVTNAFTPIAYKMEFGRDYFQDMLNMFEGEQMMSLIKNAEEGQEIANMDLSALKNFDMTFFHRLFWTFTKSANPQTAPFEQFFRSMSNFPISEVASPLMEMLEQNMGTKKKSMARPRPAMNSLQ